MLWDAFLPDTVSASDAILKRELKNEKEFLCINCDKMTQHTFIKSVDGRWNVYACTCGQEKTTKR